MEYHAVVSYLENLLGAFKAGCIEVCHKDNRILLVPSSNIHVEIEAKQKPEKESFAIEMSWTHDTAYKEIEDQISIKAFIAGQDEKDEKAVTDAASGAIRAADAAGPVVPGGERKLPDETKSVEAKNKK
jgi:amphi-Trp domain-containing protein